MHVPTTGEIEYSLAMNVAQTGERIAQRPAFCQRVAQSVDLGFSVTKNMRGESAFFSGLVGAWVISIIALQDTYESVSSFDSSFWNLRTGKAGARSTQRAKVLSRLGSGCP